MASDSVIEVLQGELERLFELDEMMRLSADLLGFEPATVGGLGSKGAFARALVGYCASQEALGALVDAILLSSDGADAGLRAQQVQSAPNGELRPGTRVGNLRIVKKIGEGGLSVVYLAESEGQGEPQRAALKVIRPQFSRDRAAVHRFTTASRIMQSLQSPGLAPILGVGHLEDARPWVAAAYLTGQTLAQRIKRTGSLHINEARPIFTGILRGLSALHKRGLLHGDVKVENVFVTRSGGEDGGGEPTGVLVDGGADRLLARAPLDAGTARLLPVMGTAKSLAPEQARGRGSDVRSDLYQMGTLMYETLAGRPPFEGESAIDVVVQQLSATPEPPSQYARKGWIALALDEIVLRALSKDPEERFQSAEELLDALERAARRSTVQRPLDEGAFQDARRALLARPDDEALAERVEELASQSGVYSRAAEVLLEVVQFASELETKLALLFRAARIYDTELKDGLRAEAAYQRVIELEPGNEVALRGLEGAKRTSGDYEGLIGLLLDRIERERNDSVRRGLLHEVATLYDKQLKEPDNALVAWAQALGTDPDDEEARKQVERLAGGAQARWNEVLEMLAQSAEAAHGNLFSDEETKRKAAEEQLAQADDAAAQLRGTFDSRLAERAQAFDAQRAQAAERVESAQQALSMARAEAEALESTLASAAERLGEITHAADSKKAAGEEARAKAEAHVEAYEQLERESGEAPSAERQAELEQIAGEAEGLVAGAETLEAEAEQAGAAMDAAREELATTQRALEAGQQRVTDAEKVLADEQASLGEQAEGAELTSDERAALDAAERTVTAARAEVDAFAERDEAQVAAQRARDTARLAQTYVLMGTFYGERLSRPDFAHSCFTQALGVDAAHEGAFEGIVDLYRATQSWPELATALLQRAEQAKSPLKARDHRAEAAAIIAHKLNDQGKARAELERVLADDPDHPAAQRALTDILRDQQDWPMLAATLDRQASALQGRERAQALLSLGEIYEDRLGVTDKALGAYQRALEADPRELGAHKGLERIYARTENYEGLVESLRGQVDLVATPKQRIGLLERIGLLLEEDFVDHAAAASCFEDIIRIDAGHEGANTALARLYRHLQRFEDLVEALDRHAATADDPSRKVQFMLQAARVLSVDIGSLERAIEMYEEILGIDEQQPEALSEVARLKSTAGDAAAAVQAVERLAEQEPDPQRQAQLRVRAGRLLQEAGDRDAAIVRYKKALDLDRTATEAAEALREIYQQRGDARGAAEMLVHAIGVAEGDLKRAELLAALGALYRDDLEVPEQAQEAFDQALSLDPTNGVAAAGLASIAFGEGRDADGVEFFTRVEARLDDLPVEQGAMLCVAAAQSYRTLGEDDKALAALDRARTLVPASLEYAERHARLLAETGDTAGAEKLYERLLSQHAGELDLAERVRLTLALADVQLQGNRTRRAIETLQRLLEQKPDDPAALAALTRAYEQHGAWNDVVNLLQLRSKRADNEEEMFDLMVKTGDVFLEKLRDRDAACQTYVMALDVKPDSRNLLTKLMAVYSEAKDWPRLIEIILRIAEMVTDPAQLAKYFNTAATIAQMELGRFDEAANYYEQSLSHVALDQGDAQFHGLVQCLTENQDWERLERAYEVRIGRLRQAGVEPARLAALLAQNGDIVQNRLGRLADSLSSYEEALELEPANEARRSMLAAIYTKEPKRFFQRAVASHRHYLAGDPYRIDSLQALRKIYTSGKKPDESWCVCQALRCLKMADVDEEKFFKKYRLTRLPKVKQPITDDLWRELVAHPVQDATLTGIFATLQPAVVLTQAQRLAAFGITEQHRIDPASDASAMGRMILHVSETTSTLLPPLYDCPQDPGGLSFLFTAPPSVGVGAGAKAGGPQQALAFVAGRHLSYFRAGHFMRQVVPTGTGLRAWLIAAIRGVAPRFPAPANMEAQVKECTDAISRQLIGPQRDALRSMTQKLLDAAPELDMKAWMAGIDLTADRIGFVLSNDLKIANAVIEASPEDGSSVGRKDRLRELLAYSISEEYFELRKRIGIALGG